MDKEDNRFNHINDKKRGTTSPKKNDWEQYSKELGNHTLLEEGDDFLEEINSSLAQQISSELEDRKTSTSTNEKNRKRKIPKGVKIFAGVFSVLMLLSAMLLFTDGGRKIILNIAGSYIYNKLDYEDSSKTPVVNDDDTQTVEPVKDKKPVEHVINILLLGVEEIEGASNTDLMIIATMNTKDKSIKLTSLMRDLYVEIPGYSNNKLNSVYAKGGINLLYDTIKLNFGVEMDGYVLVNFNTFEQIVDIFDGVEVTLTSTEANYLRTTNYISNPANRNVVAGTQIMNGNQALGYCRVRKVSTGTENNDFGRTQRQRAVLNALFDKMKEKNVIDLGLKMNEVLSEVKIKTDITASEFNNYLEEAANLKVKQLENFRIPTDDGYKNEKVRIGRYNQDVLVPKDWNTTRQILREYIYGDDADKLDISQ